MADEINNTIKTRVELDTASAQQEIVKLNSIASDSTVDLKERVEAKNKQIAIQNELNKKAISDAEKLVKSLTGVAGKEKELERAQQKLNKAKLNEVKVNTRNEKAQKKLSAQYANSQGALNKLNKATGGFVDKLKLLAANPIVLVITGLVAAFNLLKTAFLSSEEGQDRFAKGMAVLDSVIGNIMDVIADFATFLVDAFLSPQKAWDSFVGALKSGYDLVKTQIFDRWVGNFKILTGGFEKGILKMRIAWNEFTGDSEEANKLTDRLDEVNKKIEEGYEAHRIANQQLIDGYNSAKNAVSGFIEEVEKESKIAQGIADQRAKADRLERELIVERAEANKDRAAALENSVNKEKFTIKERIEFLKEAGRIEQEITDKEIEAAKIRYDAKVAENALSKSTKEDLDEEARLKARITELEFARLTKQKEVTGQIQAFTQEEISSLKAIEAFKKSLLDTENETNEARLERERTEREKALEDLKVTEEQKAEILLAIQEKYLADKKALELEDELSRREFQLEKDEYELERKRIFGEATLQDELDFLEKQRVQEVSNADLSGEEIDFINQKYQDKKDDLNEYAKQQEDAKNMAILQSGISALGEAFGLGKEAAIAQAVISTYAGIMDVWGSKSETGLVGAGLAQKIATTAIVAANGFNTIRKMVSTSGPKGMGSGGGGAASGAAGLTSTVPIPTATTTEISDLTSRNEARTGVDTSIGNQATASAFANISSGRSGDVIFSESSYRDFQDQITFRENKSTL